MKLIDKKNELTAKNEERTQRLSKMSAMDETYRQVNQTSFQQNFKFLIGHYKENTRSTRVRSS